MNLTQFGAVMQRPGIDMIPAYSPEARGHSERAICTYPARLLKELALAGITEMAAANRTTRGRGPLYPLHGVVLQLPADRHRHHFVKARLRVHRHAEGHFAVFHGPRRLASEGAGGHWMDPDVKTAA